MKRILLVLGVAVMLTLAGCNGNYEPQEENQNQNDCVGSDSISIQHFEIDEGFMGGQIEYEFKVSNAKLTQNYEVEASIDNGDGIITYTHDIPEDEFSREDCSFTGENFDDVRGDESNFDEGDRVTMNVSLIDESGNIVASDETTTRVTD